MLLGTSWPRLGGICDLPAGFRIQPGNFRGQIEEGICFLLRILNAGKTAGAGSDVTEVLSILTTRFWPSARLPQKKKSEKCGGCTVHPPGDFEGL